MAKNVLRYFIFIIYLVYALPVFAENDAQAMADKAVANILFDYEYGSEIASYSINDDGFVNMEFARNTPDKLYADILTKIKNHPDVKGVLASKTAPACAINF